MELINTSFYSLEGMFLHIKIVLILVYLDKKQNPGIDYLDRRILEYNFD